MVNQQFNKAGLVNIIGDAGYANVLGEGFYTINGSNESNNRNYLLLMNTLEDSSNINVNEFISTIFSIFRRITTAVIQE